MITLTNVVISTIWIIYIILLRFLKKILLNLILKNFYFIDQKLAFCRKMQYYQGFNYIQNNPILNPILSNSVQKSEKAKNLHNVTVYT